MTVTVTFEEHKTLPAGLTFAVMRKTYMLVGFKVWETVERANF